MDEHSMAVNALIAADRKKVSLVDHASFTLMRHLATDIAFAYDRHFSREEFNGIR